MAVGIFRVSLWDGSPECVNVAVAFSHGPVEDCSAD